MREALYTSTSAVEALVAAGPWGRLPPVPWERARRLAEGAKGVLWPLAVEPLGRRTHDAPLVDDDAIAALLDAKERGLLVLPLLDHAGPEAGRVSNERPLGPAAVPAPSSGRSPLPLDDAGWARVIDAYRDAGARLHAAGFGAAVLSVDDDGLLAAALSPRANPGRSLEERLRPGLSVWRALADAGLSLALALTVEELGPGGLDATDGVEAARAFEAEGASIVLASGGSEALPVLKHRAEARGDEDIFLASAAWLVGRTSVRVLAVGPCPDPARAQEAARALGFAGVVAHLKEAA